MPEQHTEHTTPIMAWVGVAVMTIGGCGLLASVITIDFNHTVALVSLIAGAVLTVAGFVTLGKAQ